MLNLEDKFKTFVPDITKNIIHEIVSLIQTNFTNYNESFYMWFTTNSDYDFVYIYEMNFKRYFLDNFTIETERVLSYYSQNLVYAVSSYYDMYRDLTSINYFISSMVHKQFQYIDPAQLFMEQ